MISGPKHLSNARNRLRGFRRALHAAKIAIPSEFIEFGDFRERSGQEAAQRLLGIRPPPTAMFVANNEMMAGALLAIRQERLKIPRDISLVGFDDARWAQYCDPPLTVVAQPTDAMGRRAAELVLGRLRNETRAQIAVFEPELVVRRSTSRPKTLPR